MSLRLESVVPWGRTMAEYVAMFDLTPQDLELRILDCGGGAGEFQRRVDRARRPGRLL